MDQNYRLTAENYRGQNIDQRLKRLNVVTGPKGAGKTTLRLLIQEALSNQTEDGKTARDLYRQYGNGETGYTIGFEKADGSLAIVRKAELTKKGTVTCKVSVNGSKEMSDKAAAGLLAAETMEPEDFYIGNFVNLSEEKQKNLLLSLLAKDEDIEAKKKVFADELDNSRVKETITGIRANSWIDFLLNSLEAAKTEKNSLQGEKQRLKKTTETAVELRSKNNPQNYQKLVDEKEALTQEKHEIEKAVVKEDGKREAFRKSQASIEEAKKKIDSYEQSLKSLQETQKEQEDFTEKASDLLNQKRKLQVRLEYLQAFLVAFSEGNVCPFAAESGVKCPVDLATKLEEMEKEAEEKQAAVIAIVKEVDKTNKDIKKQKALEKESEQLKAKIEEAKENKLAAERELDDLDMGQDVASQKMQLDTIDKKITTIQGDIVQAKEAEHAALMIEQARQRAENIEGELEAAKEDITTITVKIQEHLCTVIAPFEESVNEFLSQIRPAYKIRFFDEEGNYQPRCRNRKGAWASLKAISGGEKASYYPALLKAMYELKKPRFSVLLCENSEIDGDNMVNFLKGIQKSAGHIDLVLVNSWYRDFKAPEGWNRIELAAEHNKIEEGPDEDAGAEESNDDNESTAEMF